MVIEENKLSFGIHLFGYIRAKTLCVIALNRYISKVESDTCIERQPFF